MKIGILYIGIGKYFALWDDFFHTAEKYLFPEQNKIYFLFTDQKIDVPNDRVIILFQKDLGGYNNTLYRFHMFFAHKRFLETCDYLFFFNGDSVFRRKILLKELLPTRDDNYLIGLSWFIYYIKNHNDYPYERRIESSACISYGKGLFYYQGGLNGGRTKEYLELNKACMSLVDSDNKKGIVALVNDESYLNKYLLNKKIKILDAKYGKPEKWFFPLNAKIIFRDKQTFFAKCGLSYLKEEKSHFLFMTNFVKYSRYILWKFFH